MGKLFSGKLVQVFPKVSNDLNSKILCYIISHKICCQPAPNQPLELGLEKVFPPASPVYLASL